MLLLIIYSKNESKILLPLKFSLRDEKNNYYTGTDGYFSKNLEYAEINEPKILLNDGSRIVGQKAKRDKILRSFRLVETDNCWLAITEFDTKAKLNKFIKLIAADRKAVVSDSGGQGWSYIGTVRGSS